MTKATRPHVTDVRANIKIPLTAEFGPKTLILGPNGSGKSTLTAAVELALAGYASEISGKDKETRPSELRAHLTPPDGTAPFVEVQTSDGNTYSWGETGNRHLDGSVLMVPDLTGVNAWSNDKVSQWLAQQIGRRATKAMAQRAWEEVPSRVHDVIRDALHHDEDTDGPLTDRADFDYMTDRVDSYKRAKEAELRTAVKTIEAVGPAGVVDPDRIAALDAQLATLHGQAAQPGVTQAERDNAQQVYDYWTAQRPGLEQAWQAAQDNLRAAEEAVKQAEASGAEVANNRAKIQGLRDFVARANPDAQQCIVCGTAHPGGLGEHYAALLPVIDNALANLADPAQAARADLATWQQQAEEAQTNLAQAVGQVEGAQAILARPVGDGGAVQQQIADLQAQRDAMVRDQALAERASQARVDRDRLDEAVESAKAARGKLKAARKVYVEAGVSDFEDQVSRYLPDNVRFRVVTDGAHTRLGLSFGDSGPITSPSGSQEASMLAAIACAVAPDDGPAVVILPDRQWDPDHLRLVMRGLAKSDAQVVVVSTVKPKGRVPKAWTVVDLESMDGVDPLADADDDTEDDADVADGEDANAPAPFGSSPTAEAK